MSAATMRVDASDCRSLWARAVANAIRVNRIASALWPVSRCSAASMRIESAS
jgi:hypothetical protein